VNKNEKWNAYMRKYHANKQNVKKECQIYIRKLIIRATARRTISQEECDKALDLLSGL
jgi:hypothetical protein